MMSATTTAGTSVAAEIATEFPDSVVVAVASAQTFSEFPSIAKGSYGTVYKGRVPGIEKTVVIKEMTIIGQNSVNEWRKELTVMACVIFFYSLA